MINPCESCPMADKIALCCSSNPETGRTKTLKFIKTQQLIRVCDKFQTDGSCGVYDERPDDCRSFVCERVYSMGLNSEWARP